MIPCAYCDRLFSRYSIQIHQNKKCLDNPRVIAQLAASKEGKGGEEESQLQGLTKKSSKKCRSASVFARNEQLVRPNTATLYTNLEDSSLDSQHQESILQRCHVCGQCFTLDNHQPSSMAIDHQKRCEKKWHALACLLPAHIQCWPPSHCNIPSVDGTMDWKRVGQLARQSAVRAQQVRCNRCMQKLAFEKAATHVCARRAQPTVQFFF